MSQFRQDPVAGYWVAISRERSHRPIEFAGTAPVARAGGICPFCPGHEYLTPPEVLSYPAADGPGWRLRVIPNKYPALRVDGIHEVIVDSPEHRSTFGDLGPEAVVDVLAATRDRMLAWREDARIECAQMFKNNGPGSGASLEHVHSQIMGLPVVPPQVRLELEGSGKYFGVHGRCVFCDLGRDDAETRRRVIARSEEAVAIAPYAPRFPFETWIVPLRHHSHFEAAPESSVRGVAAMLHDLARRIERRLERPPYNLVLHTAPLRSPGLESYHWHVEILPRIGGIGGFEFGAGCYINALSPEESAEELRKISH